MDRSGSAQDVERSRQFAARDRRLGAFPQARIDAVTAKLGGVAPLTWPQLEGVLGVIFTSRSGSTFLARELERAFAVGRIREALNPPWPAGPPGAGVLRGSEGAWFGFKAGGVGVIAGELCGFFDAYLARTRFVRLLRGDIVAQAVSLERAVQTSRFSARKAPTAEAVYDAGRIARSVTVIAGAVEALGRWLDRTGRPSETLIYEQFAGGDITAALRVGDAIGLPRRTGPGHLLPEVRRVGDAQNLEWAGRFLREAEPAVRACVQRHQATVEAALERAGPPSNRPAS